MGYTDGKAVGRSSAGLKPEHNFPAPAEASASNQEKTQGQSALFRTYSYAAAPGVELGNQVQINTVGKGLNVAGRPSPEALRGKAKTLAPTENPSGSRSDPGKF